MRNIFLSTLIVTLLLVYRLPATAQAQDDWQQLFEQLSDIEDAEATEWEDAYELLSELSQHPIDLNSAVYDDLAQLPFLSEQDIQAISEYLDRYRPLRSIGELSLISSLSYEKRQLLTCFACVKAPSNYKPVPRLKNIVKYGKSDLLLTANVPFFKRRGDNEGYLGYPYRHNFRFSHSYGSRFRVGIVGAQDAGEPFFGTHNRTGYDFYSIYVQLKDIGPLKQVVAGRYRASFGLGLVMNTNFTLGKQGALTSLGINRLSLRPHSSTSAANYLQGAAATFKLGKQTELTTFTSTQKIDATLTSDSSGIRTIVQSGYHRTPSEMARKNNARLSVAGGHLAFRKGAWHTGATAFYAQTNLPLQPDTSAVFRRYDACGQHFWNASIDYGFTTSRFSMRGEAATGSSHGWALLHTLSWRVTSELDLLALYRFYGKRYNSLFCRSFSEGGDVQNESGIYVGATWHPGRRLSLSAYADFSYSPWPRYQVCRASHSADLLLSGAYSLGSWTVSGRYRLRRRERNDSTKTALAWRTEQRGRLAVTWKKDVWNLKTQLDGTLCSHEGENSTGWMASESAEVKLGKRWRLNASAGYFHTDNYESRVYQYERGMLYQFSFPMFYGEGIRYTLAAHFACTERLSVRARLATTNYFDRNTIGTGLQTIDHSSATALDVQLHWQF